VIRAFDTEGGIKVKEISEATFINQRMIYRRLNSLMPHKVVKAVAKGGYQLSLAERDRLEKFKAENGAEETSEA
jgi:DNA-binding IclR family transcriptional regulator